MSLKYHLSNLIQRENNNYFKSFLNKSTYLTSKYVDGSLFALTFTIKAMNVFMRQLLTIQGLDPDSEPGALLRAQTQEAFNNMFTKRHEDDFDSDYDLSWVKKKFDETRKKFSGPELTEKRFKELTDVSCLGNLSPTIEEIMEPKIIPQFEIGGDAIEALRTAVLDIEKPLQEDKIKRAMKLVDDMVTKNLAPNNDKYKKSQFDDIMKFNDEVLNALEKVVQGHTDSKKEEPSTLTVKTDRAIRSTLKVPTRSLSEIAGTKKRKIKEAKESKPEFQAELKRKLTKAKKLAKLLADQGFHESVDQNQINGLASASDDNMEELEKLVRKYAPTKDAIAENKFKGPFKRTEK